MMQSICAEMIAMTVVGIRILEGDADTKSSFNFNSLTSCVQQLLLVLSQHSLVFIFIILQVYELAITPTVEKVKAMRSNMESTFFKMRLQS